MSDLYDTDVLLWSEQQAALLRRLAAGERVNGQIDSGNVIEEVESVGSEQLHAVESFLVQALVHADVGRFEDSMLRELRAAHPELLEAIRAAGEISPEVQEGLEEFLDGFRLTRVEPA